MLIPFLQNRLQKPLPGQTEQFKMAVSSRLQFNETPDGATLAAVMLLLYQKEEDWHTILIQRTAHNKNDRHSGQISFPGGKLDEDDESLAFCALRETEEEIGIQMTNIELLGKLTPLYIPVSNFEVHPFVGFTQERLDFNLQESEVVEVLETPLAAFLDENRKKQTTISFDSGLVLPNVPYFDVHNKIVWGATAMILSEFLSILQERNG